MKSVQRIWFLVLLCLLALSSAPARAAVATPISAVAA